MRSFMTRWWRGTGPGLVALALSLAGCSADEKPAETKDTQTAAEDAGSTDTGPTLTEDTGGSPMEDVAVVEPEPQWKATFTPAGGSAEGPWVRAEVTQLDARRIAVDVRAGGMESVFGVAFKLRWDPAVLSWAGGQAKEVLTSAKAKGVTALMESAPGELVYGHALFPNASNDHQGPASLAGAPISEALLLRAELDVVAAGTTSVTFVEESQDVRKPSGEQLPTVWSGGSIVIEPVVGGVE
ncbi:MAG: hypothetical protein AMXMBFR64_03000 [Myxococcales bacterium]